MKRSSFITIAAAVAAVAGTGPARLFAAQEIVAVRSARGDRQWMVGRPGGCAGSRMRNPILREAFA